MLDVSRVNSYAQRGAGGRTRERGSAVAEFALAATVFLGLMFGIMDICRAMYAYEFVTFAARAGARWATVRGSACYTNLSSNGVTSSSAAAAFCYPAGTAYNGGAQATDIQTYVQSLHLPGIPGHLITVTTTASTVWPATGAACPASTSGSTSPINSPGCPVHVIVQYPYSSQIPFFRVKIITLTADSQMVISQ